MPAQPPVITTLPPNPDADRHSRMIQYGVAMGIRIVCIALMFVVPGWWTLIPAAGAILIPYFAVVIANAAKPAPPSDFETVRRDELTQGPDDGREPPA